MNNKVLYVVLGSVGVIGLLVGIYIFLGMIQSPDSGGRQLNTEQVTESDSPYADLNSEGTASDVPADVIPDNTPDPRIGEYMSILEPLAKAGILFKSWSTIDEIDPNALVSYFVYSQSDTSKYGTGDLSIPEADISTFIRTKFIGDVNAIKKSSYYQAQNGMFVINNQPANSANFEIKSIVKAYNANIILEQYENDPSNILSNTFIVIDRDLGDRFIKCVTNEGAVNTGNVSGNPQMTNPLQSFLKNVPDAAKGEIIDLAANINTAKIGVESLMSFITTDDLSANNLLNFYLSLITRNNTKLEGFYNDSDGYYHVTLEEIANTLNQYFDGVALNPKEITLPGVVFQNGTVNADGKSEILLSPPVVNTHINALYQIENIEVLSEDTVEITGLRLQDSGEGYKEISRDVVKLKIILGGYRFLSLIRSEV